MEGYFDHVLSWWAHKDDNNVPILNYKDMKKDLPFAVATIANWSRHQQGASGGDST